MIVKLSWKGLLISKKIIIFPLIVLICVIKIQGYYYLHLDKNGRTNTYILTEVIGP